MTRGPQPLQAIQEARVLGSKIGTIWDSPYTGNACVDLIIFCAHAIIFVKIKRTRTHIGDLLDIMGQYSREIAHLRRIPQTVVAYRELWVRSQRGSWLYYRILDDGIIEIRWDRTTIADPAKDTI
jgi:hypothetical protein